MSVFEMLARGAAAFPAGRLDAAALLQALLDVEAALVQVRAAAGLTSEAAASTVTGMCKVGLFDPEAVIGAGVRRGELVAEVAGRLRETVALFDAAAAAEVHRELDDGDAFTLARRLLLRRTLATLDDSLSQLGAALVAHGPTRQAADQVLRSQRNIRSAGAAALEWPIGSEPAGSGTLAAACAARLQLVSETAASARPEQQDGGAAQAALVMAVARLCAEFPSLVERLTERPGSEASAPVRRLFDQARQVSRGVALRAPHRVAAWLACSAADGDAIAAAAEAAALLDGSIAAATTLLAAAMALPVPSPAATDNADPRWMAIAVQQRDCAPWQRWLD